MYVGGISKEDADAGVAGRTGGASFIGEKDGPWYKRIDSDPAPVSEVYYPALIHVNFCSDKNDELEKRDLWLYAHTNESDKDVWTHTDKMGGSLHNPYHTENNHHHHFSCREYNRPQTHFTRMLNFSQEVHNIRERKASESKRLNVSNTLMKRNEGRSVYLLGNDSMLHAFPNGDTFAKMGFEFENVNNLATSIFSSFSVGEELDDVLSSDR